MANTREKLIDLMAVTSLEFEDAVALADHLIANGVTVQEWISVKDRLPEKPGKYNVCGKNVHGIRLLGAEYYLPPCPPDGLGGWCGKLNITHWMPLPQPPKGE